MRWLRWCAAVTVVSWSAAAFGGAFALAAPSAFDIARRDDAFGIRLSPSGRYLAFVMADLDRFCLARNGQMRELGTTKCRDESREFRTTFQVAIYDLTTDQAVKIMPMPKNIEVNWVEWANEDRLLIALELATTVGTSSFAIGGSRILSVEREGNGNTILFQAANSSGLNLANRWLTSISNFLPNDPDHVLMPATVNDRFSLWKVNVIDGTATLAEEGTRDTEYWLTGNDGIARIRIDCSGRNCRRLDVFTRDVNQSEWVKIRTIDLKYGEDDDDFDFKPIAATDHPSRFIVLSREDDTPRHALKIFDLETNQYLETLFEHAIYDVDDAVYYVDTGAYAGARYFADTLEMRFVDSAVQKEYDTLRRSFGKNVSVRLLDYAADGENAIVFASATDNAGQYFAYNRSKKTLRPIMESKAVLADYRGAVKSNVLNITTRDGLSITAYHSYPAAGATAETPLIVMPHGGPEARDVLDYDPDEFYFTTRGYQVLKVNFRGSSGYGRKFVEAGHRQWGGAMQDDVSDAVMALFAQGKASPDNTCIVGYSYGGYVALYGAATTPELYKCVVAGGAPSDLILDLKQTRGEFGTDSEVYEYWTRWLGDPRQDGDALRAISPVNLADKMTAPILLLHGEDDEIVDIDQAYRMRRALTGANVPHRFVKLENTGHQNWRLEVRIQYLEEVEAFLAQHLLQSGGADVAPPPASVSAP